MSYLQPMRSIVFSSELGYYLGNSLFPVRVLAASAAPPPHSSAALLAGALILLRFPYGNGISEDSTQQTEALEP